MMAHHRRGLGLLLHRAVLGHKLLQGEGLAEVDPRLAVVGGEHLEDGRTRAPERLWDLG